MELEAFKTKYRTFTVIMAVLVVLASVWLWGYHVGSSSTDTTGGEAVTKTETVTTAKASNPMPLKERSAGVVTVPVRLEQKEPAEPTDIPEGAILVYTPRAHVADTLAENNDTAFSDTLRAAVPLMQKEYRDSNYTAWVSGFMPRLDSIEVRSKVVTVTKMVEKDHFKTFNLGLTGGIGYGVLTRKPDVFVGVGVTWNIFK